MGRREVGKQNIRKIQHSSGSYYVRIPIGMMRDLRWQESQKVTFTKSGKKLIIEDWEGVDMI